MDMWTTQERCPHAHSLNNNTKAKPRLNQPRTTAHRFSGGGPCLNTTVRFLQAFNYMYDAADGFIGLKTAGTTPAQYAASIPSGLAVDGVFQCFFTWAGAAFGSPLIALQATKYNWPYTYRYDPVTQTYIGISSGSPVSGNTPATDANTVYILGADGQATSEGVLSAWLSAAGCQ
jgi:hypothetical protein